MSDLYPLRFAPVYKDYIWGGRKLASLGRTLPPGRVAESWEIAAHPAGTSTVVNGRWAGTSLADLRAQLGARLVGARAAWAEARGIFPLLVKLLDAHEPLSVQVHPDDAYARAHEGNELGKSEMWVVLHAQPGAAIVLGVSPGTTPERFRAALAAGDLEACLHRLPLQTGDVVCVPAGSVHAILGGLVIAEIQQNSNTTYRVYDWGRVGDDGRPRPLHVDHALAVINFDQVEPGIARPEPAWQASGVAAETLCRTTRFVTERVRIGAGAGFAGACAGDTLEIWGAEAGDAWVEGGGVMEPLPAASFLLLPAAMGPYRVGCEAGATLLRTFLPEAVS